jgi:hypothetical protein
LLAGASQVALTTGAFAQTAGADTTVEEVVVTGVRGSQIKSVDVKRREASIVDAISAEDIGKLPDVTIADSLQRISGVQIQRDAGEGKTVNIRGLAQVITLLNGEQYLSAGNMGSGPAEPAGRALAADEPGAGLQVDRPEERPVGHLGHHRPAHPPSVPAARRPELRRRAEAQRGERTKENDYLVNGVLNWRNDRVGLMVSAAKSKSNLGNNYSGTVGLSGNNDWGGSAAEQLHLAARLSRASTAWSSASAWASMSPSRPTWAKASP